MEKSSGFKSFYMRSSSYLSGSEKPSFFNQLIRLMSPLMSKRLNLFGLLF